MSHWITTGVDLHDSLIGQAIEAGDTWRGAHWGAQTRFAVLDIDKNSRYHNALSLEILRTRLLNIGLKANLYQSSTNGGWHLYVFFADWAESREVSESLSACLTVAGYEIKQGTLEVFPSRFQALRLPLQRGFAWLDSGIAREDIGTEQALSLFLDDLESTVNDWPTTKELIESELRRYKDAAGGRAQDEEEADEYPDFSSSSKGKLIEENYEKGREYWKNGLSKKNQRHEAIVCVEHYLWHGDLEAGVYALSGRRNDAARERLLQSWLEEKHNGFCKHINKGDWETVNADIERAVVWRSQTQERVAYLETEAAQERLLKLSIATGRAWTMEDFRKANERRSEQARGRITRAVDQCLATGAQISRKTLEKTTGCSANTLRRHGDLWRHLAAGSRDLSSGVFEISVLSSSSLCSKAIDNEFSESDSSGELAASDALAVGVTTACLDTEVSTQGTEMLRACFPVLIDQWRKRGKVTGRKERRSAPSLSETKRSTGSKHRLVRAVGTCGLNGFLPASGSPPFKSSGIVCMGSGSVRLQEGVSSRAPPWWEQSC